MTWRPLLVGEDAERARAVIDDIASALAARPIDLDGAGLSLTRGEPGIGLCFAYLARVLDEPAYAEQAEARLSASIEHAVSGPVDPGLWYGLAGIVWATEQAMRLLDIVPDEDPHAEVDAILMRYLAAIPTPKFELMGGLAGLAVYALERMPRPGAQALLERIVAALRARATPSEDDLRWVTTFDELTPGEQTMFRDGYCAFGSAHGNAGVLGALAGAAAWDIPGAREAADAALRWLLPHRLSDTEGSAFPPMLGIREPHHQASWCWGDVGIAAVLAAAADVLDTDWRTHAESLVAAIATRAPERCALTDANLCHGAIGLAHVLARRAHAWHRDDLADAARAWYRRAIAMHRPGVGIGGFITDERGETGEFVPVAYAGLLDGCAGIALALAAAVGSVEPTWDRAFLISLTCSRR